MTTKVSPDPTALGARAASMIAELGAISAEPKRLVRLFLTPEHRRAADVVAGWMGAAGLRVSEDALGTVRGHLPRRKAERGGSAARRLVIGSHIDTVVGAGKYDGIFGVVAGILALDHVVRAGLALPFAVDVLAFGDEEGSRFPSTLSSSAAVVGCFDRSTLALADARGVTFADALAAYGKSPDDIAGAAYRRDEVAAYVEVHIEQGPVLEAEDLPLGVVLGDAVALLQTSCQLGTLAHNDFKIVIRELAPLLVHLPLDLLPIAFNTIPVHCGLHLMIANLIVS